METTERKWYAVYTRPRWEKKVAEFLSRKKIENYCPLNKVLRQWSDRKKIVLEPLFTSYVFVKATGKEHSEIRKIDGIINFVYWLSKPAILRNEEIECIKDFLNDHTNVHLEKTPVNINDTVRITKGALMEYEGRVIGIKSSTVKIVLPSLGYMMVAEVEKTNIKVISDNGNEANRHHLEEALSRY
jgi:transcription antitermination factor NusG